MKKAGQIIKELRIEKGFTLRAFCIAAEIDPSNWSKVERSLLEFPKSESILNSIKELLELNDESFQELKDTAAIEAIPNALLSEEKILNALPVFFRTTRSENPNEEQLKELIELIKKG